MELEGKREEQGVQHSGEYDEIRGCENIDDLIDLLFDRDTTDSSTSLIKAFCKYKDDVLTGELKIGDDENV